MLADLRIGQYLPGNSLLHRLDPRTKLWCLIVVSMSAFLVEQWVQIAGIGLFVVVLILSSQVPLVWQVSSLKALWPLLLITLLLNAFTLPGSRLIEIGPFEATTQGLETGIIMVARISLVILVTGLFSFTTSPLQLTAGLEKLLNPFRKIGVPSGELALMMTIALRFIPTIVEEGQRLIQAVQARGGNINSVGLLKRVNTLAPLLIPLFIGVFRRADDLALAMEARCYQPGAERTNYRQLQLKKPDFLILGCTTVLFILLLVTTIF